MAEELKVAIGIELRDGELGKIQSAINNLQINPIKLQINTSNVQQQLNNIRNQIRSLSNIKINLTGTGGNGGGGQRTLSETTKAYNDLLNLARQIGKTRVQLSGLDASKNSAQITELSGQLNRLQADYNNLYSTFNRSFSTDQIDNLNRVFETTSRQIEAINAKAGDSAKLKEEAASIKEIEQAYKQLYAVAKQIDSLELKIKGLNGSNNSREIAELTNQLNALKISYQQMMSGLQGNMTTGQLQSLTQSAFDAQNRIAQLDAKIADTKARTAQGIQLKFDNGTFDADISNIETKMSRLTTVSQELQSNFNNVALHMNNMRSALATGDIDTAISEYQKYEQALNRMKNSLTIAANEQRQYEAAARQAAAAQQLITNKQNLGNDIESWLRKNTKAAREYGEELRNIQSNLNGMTQQEFAQAQQRFVGIKKEASARNLTGLTFGDALKKDFSSLSTYLSATMMIMQGVRALRSMYQNVVSVDKAMTELKKVTDESSASYDKFLSGASVNSQKIGTTIDGLVSSTADFARLGYSFGDSQELAKVANIYAVVGDEVGGVDNATKSIISTMKAFGVESNNAISIVDKYNEVGNKFAISSGGIGDAMTRSASSLAAANNTLDESIALITAANTVVQDPDSVGTAFKTISMRIRGAKTELEDAGLETEGMAESTAKLREEIKALSGVDIMQDENTFKSTYRILDELATKWGDLTDIQQASITELIAGKRQGNIVSSLMNNFDEARRALQTSLNSEGSAMKEHEKWLESAEAKVLQLKASWQGLSLDFLSSDFLKGGVDGLRGLVNVIDSITQSVGGLGTVLLGLGSALGIRGLSGKEMPALFSWVTKLAAAHPAIAATVGVLAGLATLGKVAYDSWYKNNYQWGEGLSENTDKIKQSFSEYKRLADLQKEVKELDFTIKSPDSSAEQVESAKKRLEEIRSLLSNEYNLVINTDNTGLEKAVENLKKISEAQLQEDINNSKTKLAELRPKVQNYSSQRQQLVDKNNSILQEKTNYTDFINEVSKLDKKTAGYAQTVRDLGVQYGVIAEWQRNLADPSVVITNAQAKINAPFVGLDAQLKSSKDAIDALDSSYNEYIQTCKDMADIDVEIIGRGASEQNAGKVAKAIQDMKGYIQEGSLDVSEYAQKVTFAQNGIESFADAWAKGGETLNNVINDYISNMQEFGASSEQTIAGAALIKEGFTDISQVSESALPKVISNMKEFGEAMGMDMSAGNITEIAHALGMLPENKHIAFNADGMAQIVDTVSTVSSKIEELNSKGNVNLHINAEGNVEVIDTADAKLKELSQNGQVNIKFNIDTGGFDINNLAGEKIGDITANGEVVWKSDTSQLEQPTTENVDATVNYKKGSQDPPEAQDASLNYKWGSQDPPNSPGSASVNYALGSQDPPADKTAHVHYISDGSGGVNGTAHVNGTAFKAGDWGTKSDGVALGGELGQELIVRDGRYFTIGDKGAEFFNYRKGDIIFNHKQTRELFEHGRVTSGGGRGRAFADGNTGAAFAEGTADKPEYLDWVEVALKRIGRDIENVSAIMDDTFIAFDKRTDALIQKTLLVKSEIEWQRKAYDKYIQQADSVGLSDDWIRKIQNGDFEIDAITDDDLKEKITQYQQWYDKALDCQDAIVDLFQTEKELHKTVMDNWMTHYEDMLSTVNHNMNVLDERMSRTQARGFMDSSRFYETLAIKERENLEGLIAEEKALTTALQQAMDAGEVEQYSEEWYDMSKNINEVTEAIEESRSKLIDYGNEMRKITWDRFDYGMESVSRLTDEADFLIDLMEHNDLFNDDGTMSKYGKATMGLHGLNYNTYMEEALAYSEAIKQIDEQLSATPNDINLISRRKELLELQRENILAAEEEKDAITELVQDGIDEELDALRSLIDSYTDALDAEKDLYDYRNKIANKTKEIADIQKQLAAYENDDSEETRAKVQKLRVELENSQKDLQDMQYDQYIKDQKAMLEGLYTQYEALSNERAENIDDIVSDAISTINKNSSSIESTLNSVTREVGTSLSSDMKLIWKDGKTILKDYEKVSSGFYLKADGFFETGYSYRTKVQEGIENLLSGVNSLISYGSGIAAKLTNGDYYREVMKNNSLDWYTQDEAGQQALAAENAKHADWLGLWKGDDGWYDDTDNSLFYSVSDKEKIERMVAAMKQNSSAWAASSASERSKLESLNTSMANRISDITGQSVYKDGDGVWWIGNERLFTAYKTGAYNISKNQAAWTQEDGKREVIVRPSDGAILTPIARGDSVLSAAATSNIFDMANNPEKFISENLGVNKIGEGIQSNNSKSVSIGDVHLGGFNFPGVHNYEQLKYALQHDSNFEKMIKSMTIDRVVGGSALKKYRYK